MSRRFRRLATTGSSMWPANRSSSFATPRAAIRAHYNVCRHRGSRVLLEPAGNAASITCRYHGWTYARDGRLQVGAAHAGGFRARRIHGLKPCALRIVEGLIFVCLAEGPAPDLATSVAGHLRPLSAPARHRKRARRTSRRRSGAGELEARRSRTTSSAITASRRIPQYCGVEIKADNIGDGSPAAHGPLRRASSRVAGARRAAGDDACRSSARSSRSMSVCRTAQFGAGYRAPLRESHSDRAPRTAGRPLR